MDRAWIRKLSWFIQYRHIALPSSRIALVMNSYNGKPAHVINEIMKSYIPETAGCTYADFPMVRDRWFRANEQTDKGEPCFIKTENALPSEGMKTGYIWGAGPNTWGYYHLLTKNAHKLIYARIINNKVNLGGGSDGCCGCFGTPDPATKMPSIKADDKDDMRRLFHGRQVATKPNDAQASKDQIAESTSVAQAHYQYDQNIQQGAHIVSAVNMSR